MESKQNWPEKKAAKLSPMKIKDYFLVLLLFSPIILLVIGFFSIGREGLLSIFVIFVIPVLILAVTLLKVGSRYWWASTTGESGIARKPKDDSDKTYTNQAE